MGEFAVTERVRELGLQHGVGSGRSAAQMTLVRLPYLEAHEAQLRIDPGDALTMLQGARCMKRQPRRTLRVDPILQRKRELGQ